MDDVTNIYDPANDSWTVGTSMPTTRYCTGVAIIDDTFYVVGGRSGQWGYFVDMHASAVTEQYLPVGYDATTSGNSVSETIPFEVETPETFSIAFVVGVFGGVAILGLLVYKKRKHNQNYFNRSVLMLE